MMRLRSTIPLVLAALAATSMMGCLAAFESRLSADLVAHESKIGPPHTQERPTSQTTPVDFGDGSLAGYVRHALEHSPALRAEYDQWRAATHRIPQARRLPEPVLTYGVFVRQLETRVGPQRQRFGLTQSLPWPNQLIAGADAAGFAARAAQRRVDAQALAITRRVSTAYWKLWLVAQERSVQRDQLEILRSLAISAEGRLEVGNGSLADLGQIGLSISRMADVLSGLDERRRSTESELRAALGVPPDTAVPIEPTAPVLGRPAEALEQIRAAVQEHPAIESLELDATARLRAADAAAAEGLPSFMVGLEYLETGSTGLATVAEDGKDPILVKMGLSIPLWRWAYDGKADEARAQSAAFRARRAAAFDEALAALDQTLSRLRDAERRVKLYRATLVPQAEAVYGSVLGSYQTGEATLAQVVLAQRELLDLQLADFRALAEHAAAWARLEEIIGRPVAAQEVPHP